MSSRDPDLGRLQEVMARLRDPEGGCPWDLEQSLRSLRRYLLEESYEVLEVMDGDDPDAHCDELGDLLFQVVFQSRIREEAGEFELADVVDAISEKLLRRHPHVFGEEDASDPEAVARRWEELKREEGRGGIEDVPRALPALTRAAKVGKKASKMGFDWSEVEGPLDKLEEEIAELREAMAAGDPAAAADELGDILFAAVNVSRHLDTDPELALRDTTDRFLERFRIIRERLDERGLRPEDADLETLDALWEEAKAGLERREG
ncbi:MAG: nucleoside triphosphate pyrophosphohydrolase [Myxococcota bacterium]